MNEREFYDLPASVRERFQQIPDETFDDHPEIKSLRRKLSEATDKHTQSITTVQSASQRIESAGSVATELQHARSEFRSSRVKKYTDMILDGLAPQVDPGNAEDCEIFFEAVTFATRDLIEQKNVAMRATGTAAEDESKAERHLRDRLDQLKLAEATCRAS